MFGIFVAIMRALLVILFISVSSTVLFGQQGDTCALLKKQISNEVNKIVLMTYPDLIFEKTPEGYEQYNRHHSFIETWVSMGRIGTVVSLFLDFKIWSPYAEKIYGKLPNGSQVQFEFETGEILTLKNDGRSKPEVNKEARNTIYRCHFVLSPYFFDKLSEEYLNRITIKFENRRETFEVQHPHKVRLQVPCLGFGEDGAYEVF